VRVSGRLFPAADPPTRQAFALDALQRDIGALHVPNAVPLATRVAMVELGKIAVQLLTVVHDRSAARWVARIA